MSRFAPVPALVLLLFAACGGGDDPVTDPSPEGSAAAPVTSPTAIPNQQPTPSQPLATPTPAPANAIAVSITAGDRSYLPTVAEFRGLPAVEIDAGGKVSGVSLDALAAKVGAAPASIVTMQGYRNDLKTQAFVRRPLAELGSTTVFTVDANGHLNLSSAVLPQIEWLRAVSLVAFTQ